MSGERTTSADDTPDSSGDRVSSTDDTPEESGRVISSTDDTPDTSGDRTTSADDTTDDSTTTILNDEEVVETVPSVTVGESDLSSEGGIIIMRNNDDLLYSLISIRNPITNISTGPFIDRNGISRGIE